MIKTRISKLEEKIFEIDTIITGLFKNQDINIKELDLKFDECIFDKVNILDSDISKSEFIDVIFKNSDISNTNMESSLFRRVIFEDSKLIGVDFSTSNLNNITFINNDSIHDRFIILDRNKLYSCGASFKDLGKKCFAIGEFSDKEYLNRLLKIKLKSNDVYSTDMPFNVEEYKNWYAEHSSCK